MNQRRHPHHTVIFSGARWSQRQAWQRIAHLLPANTCLLIFDTQSEKQTRLMRQVARSFRDRGRQVFIWVAPKQPAPVAYP